ncbi:hypothetical protein IFM89_037514 [Coptis chinensis]|uniref:PORR domain-containing protein n=1 Tax=Coptis chinensis TaxID=261450 RepID=A0A835IUX4_9MAGN|nr:hypothetical protein IFM89_037514 [Coptis chinensis]
MMSKDRVISADKLVHMKREFGFPDDFLCNLVPKYSDYFRLVGCPVEEKSFLELVKWDEEFAKLVIERRAEEETRLTGIGIRPSFNWKLLRGFFIRKEMREWVRDWMELPYISPYSDVSHLEQSSSEMEKRTVGVLHELLSMSLLKRMPVPIIGKLKDEYRFSNAFVSVFTRHSGLFYLSLKGGIKTAVLREAYQNEELIDRDPLSRLKRLLNIPLPWRDAGDLPRIWAGQSAPQEANFIVVYTARLVQMLFVNHQYEETDLNNSWTSHYLGEMLGTCLGYGLDNLHLEAIPLQCYWSSMIISPPTILLRSRLERLLDIPLPWRDAGDLPRIWVGQSAPREADLNDSWTSHYLGEMLGTCLRYGLDNLHLEAIPFQCYWSYMIISSPTILLRSRLERLLDIPLPWRDAGDLPRIWAGQSAPRVM